ncbi:NAD(P)-dependent alcohol dehydrogenase [Hymenobacter sp. GOD-10R]|uniref:zinc-dependent alcohol dehydrogenase family protein n=1 Tax=Hymenobacter sp. GOD-10R TaxID=3093922 RepID=UPI002D78F7B2|nr:NAD(P)-dependent alcohol dehydrogenase [Hymenobacter sp. GOD-10R]WRQ30061.1 NAD(P)-dependent alcohol dehydrogenase [Hymenobacter sp. GOD-10R]
MKAYKLHAPKSLDNFQLGDYDEPTVNDKQVKIQVKAVSLNYRDWALANGWFGYPGEKLPFIPFSDAAGLVTEVGAAVTKIKVGDRVAVNFFPEWHAGPFSLAKTHASLGGSTDGVLAEYVAFDEEAVVKVPDSFSYEEAACFPCAGVTAWHALALQAQLKPGDTVLLQGTGGVSIFGLQIVKLFGAQAIITSSSNEKLGRAKSLGANLTVNYQETPDWETKVRELTQGEGVNYVVEVAGKLAQSLKAVKAGGSIFLIGAVGGPASPEDAKSLQMAPIFMNRLQSIYVGSTEMLTDLLKAFDQNNIKPIIGKTFEFDQVKEALQFMGNGSHFGKIVVKF